MNEKMTVLPFFTQAQCLETAGKIFGLHQFLIDRGGFYTLGASAYLEDPKAYPAIANAFNMILEAGFPEMYNLIRLTLHEHFKLPVGRVEANTGLPSFHVFDADSAELTPEYHSDEPYTRVSELQNIEWDRPFTFTVPIMMPASGASVDFWWEVTDSRCENIQYELGKMYIHDGQTMHRISNAHPLTEGEYRVTLQGHGVHTGEGVIIYF
jgi:hypothetical protein